jgi:hypothetical protein
MLEYLPLIYWIGYGICFTIIFVFGAWCISNNTVYNGKIDFFDVLFAVLVYPFFSWLLLLVFFFVYLKEK